MNEIPKRGALQLVDGELQAITDGRIVGRIFVGPDGLVIQGELTCWQDEDPPKLRFASSYQQWRGALGALSWNVVRSDGRQEEVAFLLGSLAEDATEVGDLRGQVQLSVRTDPAGEPVKAWIVSDAYTRAALGASRLAMFVTDLSARAYHSVGLWKHQ